MATSKRSSAVKRTADSDKAPSKSIKVTSNHRLSPEGKRLLVLLAEHLGLDQTKVIETLVREKARAEGIT